MVLLISSIIVSCVLVLVILISIKEIDKKRGYSNGKKRYLLSLFGLLGMLLLLLGAVTEVRANQVGIIYDELNGGIQDKTYGEGLHVKSIFEHITEISTANRSSAVTTTGQTNDGQYATFQLSVIYKVKKEDAGKFYRLANKTDIPSEALNTLVKACLQSSTIQYNIFDLLSIGLEDARKEFKGNLAEALYETYYITLVNVSFDDIDGGSEVEAILQQKAEAEQKIKVAELAATANLITAENQATIERTLAEASAYAIKVQGEASGDAASAYVSKVQAMIDTLYANTEGLTYAECSKLVLSIVFYDNWDGKLPEVLTSDSLSAMIGSLITNNSSDSNSNEPVTP